MPQSTSTSSATDKTTDQRHANHLRDIAGFAEAAFWNTVAAEFPEITTGDMLPLVAMDFSDHCRRAVQHWYSMNKAS